jgi:hypothetical protein
MLTLRNLVWLVAALAPSSSRCPPDAAGCLNLNKPAESAPPLPPPPPGLQQLEKTYAALQNQSCAKAAASVPVFPTIGADTFMRSYHNFTGSAEDETPVLHSASVLLAQPEVKAFLSRADSFTGAAGLDFIMVLCVVLNTGTPLGLAQFAVQGRAEHALVGRLLNDGELMRDMLLAGGASGGKYGEAMHIYEGLLTGSQALSVSPPPPTPPLPVQCTAVPFHNHSCIHDPWGRMGGFPKDNVGSAAACCNLCRAATGCISWSWYDSTCNAFRDVGGHSKLNPGSCVTGGALPVPPAPPAPPRPAPPEPPTHPWDDRSQQNILRRLALGTALEFAVPFKYMNADIYIDPTQRYQHYEEAYLAGNLDPAFDILTVFECRLVVGSPALNSELSWLRRTMANYRPDLVAFNGSSGDKKGDWVLWRYAKAVSTDVKYHRPEWPPDWNGTHSYKEIPAVGGECGPRAWFGRFARRAFGAPVWGVKQQGHAAMSTWSPETGWSTYLGASWEHVWWNGQSGVDFNLEVQCREYRCIFQQVLRGQWAANALGEQPVDRSWTPRLPGKSYGKGGVWSALMLYLKKLTIGKYGPPPPRPKNSSLIANKVERLISRWSQKVPTPIITTSKDGTMSIPAAMGVMGRNSAVMHSFDDGQQLLHTGEWKVNPQESAFEYTVSADTAHTAFLTVNFSTWHINQDLLLVLTDNTTRSLPVFWTAGEWNQSQPIPVELRAGNNTLRCVAGAVLRRALSLLSFSFTAVSPCRPEA